MASNRRNTLIQRLRRTSSNAASRDADITEDRDADPNAAAPANASYDPIAAAHPGSPSPWRYDAEDIDDPPVEAAPVQENDRMRDRSGRSFNPFSIWAKLRFALPSRPQRFRGPAMPIGRLGLAVCPIAAIATLALLAILAVWSGESRLQSGLSGRMTVELPATDNVVDQAIEIGQTVALLNDWPGIAAADPIDRDRVEALLAPWFGGAQDLGALPLPALIDVTVDDSAEIDTTALELAIRQTVPDAQLDDHRAWSADVASTAATLRLSAWIVFLAAVVAFGAAVIVVTTIVEALWRPAMREMHRLGADDRGIVAPMAWNFSMAVLIGTTAGSLIGIGLSFALTGLQSSSISSAPFDTSSIFGGLIDPRWWHIAVIVALPPMAAFSAALACCAIFVHRLRQLW